MIQNGTWTTAFCKICFSLLIFGVPLNSVIIAPRLTNCGRVLEGTGDIEYVANGLKRCVWTLVNEKHALVSVDLLEGGFEGTDGIEIIYWANGTLHNPVVGSNNHCDGPILSSRGRWCIVNSSLVFLVFRMDQFELGREIRVKVNMELGNVVREWDFESFTLVQPEGFRDCKGPFRSNEVVTWTLLDPRDLVVHDFNVTEQCVADADRTNSANPVLRVYQASERGPTLIQEVCGSAVGPIRIVNPTPKQLEPYIIIYDNGRRYHSRGELKFYWNMDVPKPWVPEPGSATTLKRSIWVGFGFALGIVLA